MTESSENSKYGMKIWFKIFPYLKKMRKHIVIVLIFLIISAITEASYPLFTSYAVNHFVIPGTSDGILAFALFFAASIVLEGIAVIFFSRHSMILEMETGKMLKRDCFVHLQVLPVSYYSTNSVGYILARVMSDTNRISGIVSWGFIHLAWSLCYVIGVFVFMFILNYKLALLLLLIIPIVTAITWLFEKKILVVNRKMRKANAKIVGAYNEGITGAKTSKTLVIEDKNCEEFKNVTSEMYRESVRSSMLSAILLPITLFFGSMAVAVVLFRGGYLVMSQLLDYGVLAAFISYAMGVIDPIYQIIAVITEIVSSQACVERVTALLEEKCAIVDSPEVIEKYGDAFEPKRGNWEPIKGNIEFKDVWFKYPDGDEYVLENFSLNIPAGTNVAIVGETGAGKSTMVNLACRFFEPIKGEILIDGIDYRERSQLWLHSSLGYVLQNPHLFSGTIMENIRFGRLDATDDEVVAAAKMVSADVVTDKMPDGFETDVGEGGDRLSTGEKQLISFARAVIANPPIFVLDEATSSIDTETEQLIQNAISHILSGRTSFIIAHRISTIRRADLILVVENGRIVEQGTHQELINKRGNYYNLYRAMQLRVKEEEIF